LIEKLGIKTDKLYKGKGCQNCFGLGYKGRTGIFELLVMSSELRSLIVENPKFDDIQSQAIIDGMKQLATDGIQKVKNGEISLDELIRSVF